MDQQKKQVHIPEEAERRAETLKQQHGTVFIVAVEGDEGKVHVCYLKRPNMAAFKRVSELSIQPGKEIEASEVLMASCWIEGDTRIQTEPHLFMPAMSQMQVLIQFNEAAIKKK